jgi:hypothetical protein
VAGDIRKVLAFVSRDEKAFAVQVMEKSEAGQKREIAANKRLITQKRKRINELDTLFEHLYEDHVAKKLNDERFAKMSAKYEQEQLSLQSEVVALEAAVTENEGRLGNVDRFIELVREYVGVKTLTPGILNALIDKIVVHEPEIAYGNSRTQKVEIFYIGVGTINTEQETAPPCNDGETAVLAVS